MIDLSNCTDEGLEASEDEEEDEPDDDLDAVAERQGGGRGRKASSDMEGLTGLNTDDEVHFAPMCMWAWYLEESG